MDHYFTDNSNLKSNRKELEYKMFNESFLFFSDLGVFSKGKVDSGSDLLIKTFLKNNSNKNKILDVGCGYGVIGIVISKLTNSSVDLIDINKRSIHLTKLNIKKNKVNANAFYSDAYENISEKYDVIISNPPIRVGKEKVLEILQNAKKYLHKNAELWFVMKKNQGALTIKKILEENYYVKIMEKDKGYFVFMATIN